MLSTHQRLIAAWLVVLAAGCNVLEPASVKRVTAGGPARATSTASTDVSVTLYGEPHEADALRQMLLSVDGETSGLDFDQLDGNDAADLAASDHAHPEYVAPPALDPLLLTSALSSATLGWDRLTDRPVRTLAWWAGERCLMLESGGVIHNPTRVNTWRAACDVANDTAWTVYIDLDMPTGITIQEWGIFHAYQDNDGTTSEKDWTCELQQDRINGCPTGQATDCQLILPGLNATEWAAVHKKQGVSIPVGVVDSTQLGWRVVCQPPSTDIQRHYFISAYIRYVET